MAIGYRGMGYRHMGNRYIECGLHGAIGYRGMGYRHMGDGYRGMGHTRSCVHLDPTLTPSH